MTVPRLAISRSSAAESLSVRPQRSLFWPLTLGDACSGVTRCWLSRSPRKRTVKLPWRPIVISLSLLAMAAAGARAQDYPSKPVRIITHSAPGGSPDALLRIFADNLSQLWGQQVVALNHPGAGGALAARIAAGSPPDGYTLYMPASSAFVTLPGLQANLPLDVPRDFVPIGFVGEQPFFISVAPALGVATLPELIALAKKRPGEISYAATGRGTLSHLSGEALQEMAGIKLLMVPYVGGTAQALNDVIGGRVPMIIDAYSGLAGALQGGAIKPVAVGSTKRLPEFADLPTAAETLPGYSARGWLALVAPLGTPDAIVRKVSEDLRKVASDPAVKAKLAATGNYTNPMSPAELLSFIRSEQQLWKPVLEQIAHTP